MEAQRFSRHHIEGRQAEARAILTQIQNHIQGIVQHIASLQATVDAHLWVQPGFSNVAKQNLENVKGDATKLETRMQTVIDGISKLPVLEEDAVE
jgi:hypothetical protein